MIAKRRAVARQDHAATLTQQMEIVLDRLVAGDTVIAAATAAAVDRTTVHRWKRDHWAFQAELNRRRRELHERLQSRLAALAEQAADNIAAAVSAGDLKTSRWVLERLAPTRDLPTPEAENPDLLRLMAERRESDVRESEFFAEFGRQLAMPSTRGGEAE
jgi:hypothetical protein